MKLTELTIMAVGDIALTKRICDCFLRPKHPLENVSSILSKADLRFGNLETPITSSIQKNNCHYSKLFDDSNGKRVFLKSELKTASLLKKMPMDIVSLANNHIIDYGRQGLAETREILTNSGLYYVGAGENLSIARKPVLLNIKSRKLGFLAYSFTYEATRKECGCAPIWKFLLKQDIVSLKKQADTVIVSLHFGREFSSIPTHFQKSIARFSIDRGADIIIGHHPHVLQPVEIYRNKIIAYSLGNFIFDPMLYPLKMPAKLFSLTKLSAIIQIKIREDGQLSYSLIPIYMDKNYQMQLIFRTNFAYDTVETNNIVINSAVIKKVLLLIKLNWVSLFKGSLSNELLLSSRLLNYLDTL